MEQFLQRFPLELSAKSDEDTVSRIAGSNDAIDPQLHSQYSDSLRRGVAQTMGNDYPDLAAQLQANAARFAAYKAARATSDIRSAVGKDGDVSEGVKQLHNHRRWQAAEYNTAVARTRTAKQWAQFNDEDHRDLFPNLQWLPSRSPTPREQHIPFYNIILPKTDIFWQHNQPGNLWNCKCDWQETMDEAISKEAKQKLDVDNIQIASPGCEGNPGITGELFSPKAAYFKNNTDEKEQAAKKIDRNKLSALGRTLNRNKHITLEIDKVPHEFSFDKYRKNNQKVDVCHHFAGSMIGSEDFWLKNEILVNPQRYLKDAVKITGGDVDNHNTGIATKLLKEDTECFYYYEVTLANKNKVILHIGKYKNSGKLYLYAASKELPEYVKAKMKK